MAYYPYLQNTQQPYYYPQTTSGGFVSVGSEQEARMYPVAPGNSVTFKHDTQPYVYVKTQSFNQMEPPAFKKYKLVEELTDMPAVAEKQPASWATKEELTELKQQVAILRSAMDVFTEKGAGDE